MNKPARIVFLLGPSGVGKTTLGDAIAERLGMLHILFDGHPAGNGVDVSGLRSEWDALLEKRIPQPLADEVRRRIEETCHSGVVISCSSGVMLAEDELAAQWHFPRSLLSKMAPLQMQVAVLFGPLETCMDSAIRRVGSAVTVETWSRDNANWQEFNPADFSGDVLEAFKAGQRRPVDELVEEFQRRFLA